MNAYVNITYDAVEQLYLFFFLEDHTSKIKINQVSKYFFFQLANWLSDRAF